MNGGVRRLSAALSKSILSATPRIAKEESRRISFKLLSPGIQLAAALLSSQRSSWSVLCEMYEEVAWKRGKRKGSFLVTALGKAPSAREPLYEAIT